MIIRKVQATPGRYPQFFVYLPKRILEELGIGKGDYVIVEHTGRRIVIRKLR